MNTDAQQQVLEKVLIYLEKTEKFVESEAPLYVQELLAYSAWEAKIGMVTWSVAWLFLAMVTGLLVYKAGTEGRYSDWGFPAFVMAVVLAVMTIIAPIGVLENRKIIHKIETAPRVFVMEKLRGGK